MSMFSRYHNQGARYAAMPPRIDPTTITPGALLDAEGVEQAPSPVREDEIARSARRLLDLHLGETKEP